MIDRPPDSYRMIARATRAETVVLASRFIADAIPVADDRAAAAALAIVRKEFHNAAHHCWAWRIGAEIPHSRFHDDGEPNGTAGRPILVALERHNVTNILLVVTRYFGGTKLGTGGLARAYSDAADAVVMHAPVITHDITVTFTIITTYDALPRVKATVYQYGFVIEEEYGERPRLRISVVRGDAVRLRAAITDAARGQAEFRD